MNKLLLAAIAVFTLAAFSHNASAQVSYYGGAGYTSATYSLSPTFSKDLSLPIIVGRAGAQINEFFSLEGRFGLGIGDDSGIATVGSASGTVTVELQNFFGGYARGGIPVSDKFYPYLIAGFSRFDLEACGAGGCASNSDSDMSFGLGADIQLNEMGSINIEYMNYYDDEENGVSEEASAFNIGYVHRF